MATISAELLLGAIGTLTGSASLIISFIQWRSDNHKLKIAGSVSCSQSATQPEWHFELDATLVNHGRRTIKIIELGLLIGEKQWEKMNGSRVFMKASRLQPFSFKNGELELEEGGRRNFTVNPLDLGFVQNLRSRGAKKLIIYAIDSLDNEYRTKINLPNPKDILMLDEADQPNQNEGVEQDGDGDSEKSF